jgi:hypothetical protein
LRTGRHAKAKQALVAAYAKVTKNDADEHVPYLHTGINTHNVFTYIGSWENGEG